MAEDNKVKVKKEIKVAKFEWNSDDPGRFSIGDKDFDLIKGDKTELPEENPYVKTLEAQGFLNRVK